MSSVRCLNLGVRLFRSEIGFPILTRPRVYDSSCLTYVRQRLNAYAIYRSNFAAKGHFSSQNVLSACRTRNEVIRTTVVGHYSAQQAPQTEVPDEETQKLSVFQRYKKMLKEYWYVLIPVHCVTSVVWFGSFYYAATCGVDIVPLLEYLGVSETLIKPLRSSSLGHLAVASAFYKLATPARYTVTLGGTTLAIRVLTKRGLIKPMPSKAKMKEIVKKKKDDYIQRKAAKQ